MQYNGGGLGKRVCNTMEGLGKRAYNMMEVDWLSHIHTQNNIAANPSETKAQFHHL